MKLNPPKPPKKRLQLNKETLRALSTTDLRKVVGGTEEGGDDDKEPPSENGLKKLLDKAAKGMQKKDSDPKPNEKQVAEQLAKTIQDLQSNDPKRREQAKEFLKDLARNAKAKKDGGDKEPKSPPQKPVSENLKKEMEKLAG